MRAAKRAMDSSLGRLQLAIELVFMIFKEIDNVYDAIMLGLTHDTLMVIGWDHIRALLVRDSAPWAGSRIVCAGDRGNDLPKGVLSEQEEEEYYRLYLEAMGQEPERFNLHQIFNWLHGQGSREVTREDHQRLMRLSSEERRLFRTITEKKKERYQWEHGWVLVNQTKKEYVTSKAASKILPSMEATDARCFGQLIVFQICWSSYRATDSLFDWDAHRGYWAGNRFVIVTTDVFEAMHSAQGWKDVTAEAAKRLREILLP